LQKLNQSNPKLKEKLIQ